MAISDLDLKLREELSELYKGLADVVKAQEDLDAITRPLYDELSTLEKQEKEYDLQYEKLSGSTNLDDIVMLKNLADDMVEIANSKEHLLSELDKHEPKYKELKRKKEEYSRNIDNITNDSVLGSNVTYLEKKGNVVDTLEKVNTRVIPALLPDSIKKTVSTTMNISKNQIIQTRSNVSNYIKGEYGKSSDFLAKLENIKESTITFLNNIKGTFTDSHNDMNNKRNELIESYKRENEMVQEAEEEASNMKLYNGKDELTEPQVIASRMYMGNYPNPRENLDSKVESTIVTDILDKDDPVKNAISIDNLEKKDIILCTQKKQPIKKDNDKVADSNPKGLPNLMNLFPNHAITVDKRMYLEQQKSRLLSDKNNGLAVPMPY